MNFSSLFNDVKRIRENSDIERFASAAFRSAVIGELKGIAADVKSILDLFTEPEKPVGIVVSPGVPTPRPKEGTDMATPTVKLVKKSQHKQLAQLKTHKPGDAPPPNFVIQDNEDSTFTVMGVDSAGFPVDLSATAKITSNTSDNPASLTVDPPAGMAYGVHGIAPGSANVITVVTANDGSFGPFTYTLPTTETTGPAGGIVVTPGTPTVRP